MVTTQQRDAIRMEQANRGAERLLSNAGEHIRPGQQLHATGEEVGAEVVDIRYQGLLFMWNTKTGVRSRCLPYMRDMKLRERFPDGSPVWTFSDPQIPQRRGTLLCYLHPDRPEAAPYHAMGYTVCHKQGIPSVDALERHMKKHSGAWAAIQRDRVEAQRNEDRAFMREQAEFMRGLVRQQVVSPPLDAPVGDAPAADKKAKQIANLVKARAAKKR